jgi:hypothetical protein
MIRCSLDIVVEVGNSEEYSVSTLRHTVPECIKAYCEQVKYSRWLHRMVAAHTLRDLKRDMACTIARYKAEIHAAVCSRGDLDFYTGEPLDWSLISTYDNESSKTGKIRYKKTLSLLQLSTTHLMKRANRNSSFVLGMSTMPKAT